MRKTLTQLQSFLNTHALDFDTLRDIAETRGYDLDHYVMDYSIYILRKQ